MSKLLLLHTPHFTSVRLRSTISSLLSKPPPLRLYIPRRRTTPPPPLRSRYYLQLHRSFSGKAFDTRNDDVVLSEEKAKDEVGDDDDGELSGSEHNGDKYPSGEFEFREFGAWESFLVKCRMFFAFPWERVRKGSVLTMKLRGQVQNFTFSMVHAIV